MGLKQMEKIQNFIDAWIQDELQTRSVFQTLFRQLGQKGIASVLVEPGPTLYTELKKNGLIDELIVLKGKKKIKVGLPLKI